MKTQLFALFLLSSSAAAACSPASAATGTGATPASPSPAGTTSAGAPASAVAAAQQVSEANGVTVTATWGGPDAGAVFEVTMDTHSGSLDATDLTAAVLRSDRGQPISGATWAAPAGGHHRSGQLTFTGDASGVINGASWVELVLQNVGGVPERVLRWEVRA